MNRFIGTLSILLVLACLDVTSVRAADYYGYTQGSDGLWYYPGVSYGYAKTWVPGYYSGCYYYPGYYSYVGQGYAKAASYAAPTYSADWKVKLLDTVVAQNKRLRALDDHASYERSLALVGLTGYFQQGPSYGGGGVPAYGGTAISTAGIQGNTVSGYGVRQYTESYAQIDVNTLLQQYARSIENANQLASLVHQDVTGVVSQVNSGAARVAEINANAQALLLLKNAIQPQPSTKTETRTFMFRVGPDGKVEVLPQPAPLPGNGQPTGPNPTTDPPLTIPQGVVPLPVSEVEFRAWQAASGPKKCLKCHSGAGLKGGFDITKFHPSLVSEKDWSRTFDYITRKDKSGCPKEGVTLTTDELLFFNRVPVKMGSARE